MSDELRERRAALCDEMDASNVAVAEAYKAAREAKTKVLDFDAQHPEVMEKINIEKGETKKKERGSSGTTIEAEGHVTIPSAQAEGG